MIDQPSGKKPLLLLVEDEPDTVSLVKLIMEGKRLSGPAHSRWR
jgi:hypothetical protein